MVARRGRRQPPGDPAGVRLGGVDRDAARETLTKDGICAAVVSMPCWELSESQSQEYRDGVLGGAPRVAVEAAVVGFGWDRWTGPRGTFIGMHGFGASAPGEALYPHFGIPAERVAQAARALL